MFNDSLIQQVLCVKKEHIAWNTESLRQRFKFLRFQTPKQTRRDVDIGFKRSKHFMMDRCIKSFEQMVNFLLLFQLLLSCDVYEIDDLALSFVEYQIHPLYDDGFLFRFACSFSHKWLHGVLLKSSNLLGCLL